MLDKRYWHIGIFTEKWPDFSLDHLIRSFIIFISILAILWSLIGKNKPRISLIKNNDRRPLFLSYLLGIFSLSIIISYLFISDQKTFSTLSLEDGLIEWLSALLLFGSCIIMAVSYIKIRKVIIFSKSIRFSLLFLSLVFFVIAMEEISWFQRQLGIETPAVFDANLQGEINLHNFATNYVENIYYFGAFLFLVTLPFARCLFQCISNNSYLNTFTPRPFIAIIGSISCAYNFDMWEIIFTQIAFFGSVIILFTFAIFSRDSNEKYIVLFTISLIIITQTLFLNNGEKFIRLWEVTEYKELFIPLAFFMYSLDTFNYINRK